MTKLRRMNWRLIAIAIYLLLWIPAAIRFNTYGDSRLVTLLLIIALIALLAMWATGYEPSKKRYADMPEMEEDNEPPRRENKPSGRNPRITQKDAGGESIPLRFEDDEIRRIYRGEEH